jgi:chromosome condensin MukBEF MukE localization factor
MMSSFIFCAFDLSCSSLRRMRRVGLVACMGEDKSYAVMIKQPQGKGTVSDTCADARSDSVVG